MLEKSALAWEGGGARAPPFHYIYKVAVYAPAERAIFLFLLYPYVLCEHYL